MSNGEGSPFAGNLRLAQDQKGLTNQQVAEACGVSTRLFQKWRNGYVHPTYPNVRKLAKALGKTPDWFYVDREER